MKKTKKGFTLVELVIVVAVMAVLVAVAIPTVSAITGTAKTNVQKTNARTIESMIKLEQAELSKGTDGTEDMNPERIAIAIQKAKLGITEGIYVYNINTGDCEYKSATGKVGDIKIDFSTAGKVTVSDHNADAEKIVSVTKFLDATASS